VVSTHPTSFMKTYLKTPIPFLPLADAALLTSDPYEKKNLSQRYTSALSGARGLLVDDSNIDFDQ